MNNLLSLLVDARISASEKDLPVLQKVFGKSMPGLNSGGLMRKML